MISTITQPCPTKFFWRKKSWICPNKRNKKDYNINLEITKKTSLQPSKFKIILHRVIAFEQMFRIPAVLEPGTEPCCHTGG